MPRSPKQHRAAVAREPERRPPPSQRGYGRGWQKIRAAKLAAQPLCAECELFGLVVAAAHVDHVDNDRANCSDDNLRPLCASCHSRKTVERDGGLGRAPIEARH